MAEKGMFRTALSGFHKQDVLEYIDQITAEWDAERQALAAKAQEADERVAAAEKIAAEAGAAIETARSEAAFAKEQLADMSEQLYHATNELDTKNVALKSMEEVLQDKEAELAATKQELEQLAALRDEAISYAADVAEKQTELEATSLHLQQTEAKLAEQSVRLTALQQQISDYETVLGNARTAQEHIDHVVRPFIDQANRQADETLDSVQAVLAGVLSQLGELQGNVDQRRQALRRCKAESDTRLSAAFGDWIAQAKHAQTTNETDSTDSGSDSRHFFR